MSATISPCGLYRYTLERKWAFGDGDILWVMLNPSTADAENDDPTITRCIGYSKAWGYNGLMVGNLYAYRTAIPAELWDAMENIDIARPENDEHLRRMAACAKLILCAWGAHADHHRAVRTMHLLRGFGDLYCIGTTKAGQPLHPLYKPKNLRPILYMGWAADRDMKDSAIARGFARWNPETRKFQWKEGDGWEEE